MKAVEYDKIKKNRSIFDQLVDLIRDNGVNNTEYGPAAAGQGVLPAANSIVTQIKQIQEQVLSFGVNAVRLNPILLHPPGVVQLPPAVTFQAPTVQASLIPLPRPMREAIELVEELEANQGTAITLRDDWAQQGYHFDVSRFPRLLHAAVFSIGNYNDTFTIYGAEIANYLLDDAWFAYLVHAEAGNESVTIVTKDF